MTNDFIISEFLFSIIILIGAALCWEFIRSRNGILRKLMIWYFATEIFVYTAAAIYAYCGEYKITLVSIGIFRMIILIPKACIKLRLLYYLKFKK